jgi:intergrase/recombinase
MAPFLEQKGAGRLAWLGHWLYEPYSGQLDFNAFNQWLSNRYAKSYQATILSYVKRFHHIVFSDNVRELETLPQSIRNNCIKSLTILSKFSGIYDQWIEKLKRHGIKLNGVSSYNAFLRIMNNSNNSDHNVIQWINETKPILRDNENLVLRFLLNSGVRKDEAITSFNMIMELANENRLGEYYDPNLNCLMHFKYPKLFIRRTKNLFVSFIPQTLINEIAKSKPVTYSAIRKRLEKKGIHMRINEVRDYFATLLISNGFNELEVNLLQGRINGILFKHYWSPKLSELRDRVFKVLETLPL